MTSFNLSELAQPFTSQLNPSTPLVEDIAIEWARAFGLLRTDAHCAYVRNARVTHLMGWAYPHAGHDALLLISCWNIWLLLWEDQCGKPPLDTGPDQLGATHARFLGVLSGTAAASVNPFEQSLADLASRLRHAQPAGWYQTFIHTTARMFESWEWEAQNRADAAWPSIEAYLSQRIHTVALLPYLVLSDVAWNYPITDAVERTPDLAVLGSIAARIIAFANDILGVHKEDHEQDMHNLVRLLEYHHGMSRAQAYAAAIQKHNQQLEIFATQMARLAVPTSQQHASRRYIDTLQSWIAAANQWTDVSCRYAQAQEVNV